ncbi:hypothetical protein ABHN03_04025 [Paenibacillus sp. NRS-1775]|uniref:hypothetical protein n=1 Tax=unclassified Paenibacillus TaxID=185978 RepID=UPI003D27AB67
MEALDEMLNGYGIVTRNSEGNWREFGCIMLELQYAWKGFSDTEKVEILNCMALN